MKHALMVGGLLCTLVAVGCAGNSALRTESSTAVIRAAEEVGVSGVPRAEFHLQLAKEELANAQDLAKRGEKDKATSLLRRADADAELAILLSREQSEKDRAVEALERVRRLQSDNR